MPNEPRRPPEVGSNLRDTIQAAIIGVVIGAIVVLFFAAIMFAVHNHTKRIEACIRLNMQWVRGNCVDTHASGDGHTSEGSVGRGG